MQADRFDDGNLPRLGTFLGKPMDFRAPDWEQVRECAWNTTDPRLFTPKASGWGYDLNVYQLLTRLGFIEQE